MIETSLCIVNHRTPELTIQCIQSIVETVDLVTNEIILVNNTLDDEQFLRQVENTTPNLRLIQNSKPLGFGSNQNQMFTIARGRYLMPLNSDTVLKAGALNALVRFMDTHADVAVAGPKLVYGNGELQPSCRNFPAVIPSFFETSGLWNKVKGNRFLGKYILLCHPHDEVTEAEWLHGACFLVRKSATKEVGFYDDQKFFMFGEDVDWCWRFRKLGWRIMFVPDACIVHYEGKSPLSGRMMHMFAGGMVFVHKHYTPLQFLPIRISSSLGLLIRILLIRNNDARIEYLQALKILLTA